MTNQNYNFIIRLKDRILENQNKFKTPCYLFDSYQLDLSVKHLKDTFTKNKMMVDIYYALKSNPYNQIIKHLSKSNIGVDVSSRQELSVAVGNRAKKIIVTGPAKTKEEIKKYLKCRSIKIIFIDSITELNQINILLNKGIKPSNRQLKFGLRIVPKCLQTWDKFGLSLPEAIEVFKRQSKLKLKIQALQFHISYVTNGTIFKKALKEIAVFSKKISKDYLKNIEVIDIGGGFCPQTMDEIYTWNRKQVSLFDITKMKRKILTLAKNKRTIKQKISPLEEIVKTITQAWKSYIAPNFPNAGLQIEPGRFLSQNCMHILLKVVDKKSKYTVILDGGWNMLGWEKYQYVNYAPIFNLNRFSTKLELPVIMYGNLCLPDDIWGYYQYGKEPQINDLLLIPFQGAYTYTYRQSFIRGIPKVYKCQ